MVSLEEKTTSMTGEFVERVGALPWGVYTCIHLHTPVYRCILIHLYTPGVPLVLVSVQVVGGSHAQSPPAPWLMAAPPALLHTGLPAGNSDLHLFPTKVAQISSLSVS